MSPIYLIRFTSTERKWVSYSARSSHTSTLLYLLLTSWFPGTCQTCVSPAARSSQQGLSRNESAREHEEVALINTKVVTQAENVRKSAKRPSTLVVQHHSLGSDEPSAAHICKQRQVPPNPSDKWTITFKSSANFRQTKAKRIHQLRIGGVHTQMNWSLQKTSNKRTPITCTKDGAKAYLNQWIGVNNDSSRCKRSICTRHGQRGFWANGLN